MVCHWNFEQEAVIVTDYSNRSEVLTNPSGEEAEVVEEVQVPRPMVSYDCNVMSMKVVVGQEVEVLELM